MADESPEHWLNELSDRIVNLLSALEGGQPRQMEFIAALAELKARGFRFVHTHTGPRIEPIRERPVNVVRRRQRAN